MNPSPLQRIYKLKTIILSLTSLGVGIALLIAARSVDRSADLEWVQLWPIGEVGGTLVAAGIFGIAWDYLDGRDRELREDERIRRLLRDSAPDFRDAVVRGFAVQPEDLARVATPELLDSIASNVLALRLGDRAFASELYADLRDQAIRAPERWQDVQVRARLSSALERSATGAPLFDVLVEWEYTVVPTHPVQRFACVSDRSELQELLSDLPATIPHYVTPGNGLAASERSTYELLSFSVDGEERTIRRAARRGGQTYSAAIGEDVVRAGEPVRIRSLYRTVTPQNGHRLYFEAVQPTRGFSLEVDYTDTAIAHMSVTDLISSSHRSQVSTMPQQVDAHVLGVDLPGWMLPKAGFAFVWTLASEQPRATNAPDHGSVPAKTA